MGRLNVLAGILVLQIVFLGEVCAQTAADSLKSYDLPEVVIGGEEPPSGPQRRLFRIPLSRLAQQDKENVAEVLRQLPSAHLQTNSRGETLIYIRAAGERQVALFLDGAPLNIGWDNRVDLSMIPSNVLGGITLERGAVSSSYGPNVSGGTIQLLTRSLSEPGSLHEIKFQGGSPFSLQSNAVIARRSKRRSLLVGGGVSTSEGVRVPRDTSLPFSQLGSLRTNTDKRSATIYVRMDRQGEAISTGITALHMSSAKGVAPESHLDPALENVRFWRYPVWRNSMVIANGVSRRWPVHLFSTVWVSRFQQHIVEYESDSYSTDTFRQEDLDLSGGFRGIAEWKSGNTTYRGIGFVSTTSHKQVDVFVDNLSGDSAGPEMKYSSALYSLGSEFVKTLGERGVVGGGMALDGFQTLQSADKPSQPALHTWSLNLRTDLPVSQRTTFHVTAGSKPRFPTMRELYGVALERFILNLDLKSERAWMVDAGLSTNSEQYSIHLTTFFQRTTDTIDQINRVVDGVRKRQRINLDGSRVWGVELSGVIQFSDRFEADGSVTWMRPIALTDGETRHVTEKPEVLSTINITYRLDPSTRIVSTILHTGRAWGLGLENEQIALPISTELNVRLSKNVYFSKPGILLEGYAGVDNAFDTLKLPQQGLPAAGRSARVGLNLSY